MKKPQPIASERAQALDELVARMGVCCRNLKLLDSATTHRSYASEHDVKDNERLEFFGDAVLKFVVAEYLFAAYPDMHEGELTEISAVLISAKTLESVGTEVSIDKCVRLGKGVPMRGSIIARAMEAVLGALYLDSKFKNVRPFIVERFCSRAEMVANDAVKENYKAQLQQYSQARAQGTPTYTVLHVEGPPHDPLFKVGVLIGERIIAEGSGRSKKAAEQEAARAAFANLTGG